MVWLIGLLAGFAVWLALAPAAADTPGAGAPAECPAGLASRLEQRLQRRRLPITPTQYLLLLALLPFSTIAAVWLLTGGWLTALVTAPAGVMVTDKVLTGLAQARTRALRDQLQETLFSLATSLKAGQSLPNALERCLMDLRRLHPRGAPILAPMAAVVREVRLNTPVDLALTLLRDEVPLEEVTHLVDAVISTRRRGGNMVEVIGNVAHMIADRMAIDRELRVLTAQKRAEAAILALLPLIIYTLQRVISPAYLTVFTATVQGQMALGLIFLAIAAGYWLADRMVHIEA